MKEQYIKQVEKELNLSRKAKTEVVRDLNEIFASATEHGETEQQVIERLGTPKEFADSKSSPTSLFERLSAQCTSRFYQCTPLHRLPAK